MAEAVTVGGVLAVLGAIVGVVIVGALLVAFLSFIAEGFKH